MYKNLVKKKNKTPAFHNWPLENNFQNKKKKYFACLLYILRINLPPQDGADAANS